MPKYTIQQASEGLSIPKSTLRYWEKEFPSLVTPKRTRGGQRRYDVKDLAVFEAISNLKKRGLTLFQIKQFLLNRDEEDNCLDPAMMGELTERLTGVVRRELSNFLLNREKEKSASDIGKPEKNSPKGLMDDNNRVAGQKATAILQGRLSSTRLPGKVMLTLVEKPVMQHVYERILHCRFIDRIIVATTKNPEDDVIDDLFGRLKVSVFRGSASDPLDRYYRAAERYNVQHIVRIMADCPLVDPQVVDAVVEQYFNGNYDFCCLGGDFPVGLDTTVFSFSTLRQCWKESVHQYEREHITLYITNHPERFRIGVCERFNGLGHLRWAMDHQVDYELINAIYKALYKPGDIFLTRDILEFLKTQGKLSQLNAGIARDEGIRRSIEEEKNSLEKALNNKK